MFPVRERRKPGSPYCARALNVMTTLPSTIFTLKLFAVDVPNFPANRMLVEECLHAMGISGMRGMIRTLAIAAGSVYTALTWLTPNLQSVFPEPALTSQEPAPPSTSHQPLRIYLDAYVTGYNTVSDQTDDTPCIAASGANICGRRDAIACPRLLKLGTVVEIDGRRYVCEDRTARKFDGRFDISCDKDKRCPYQVSGWAIVAVLDDESDWPIKMSIAR